MASPTTARASQHRTPADDEGAAGFGLQRGPQRLLFGPGQRHAIGHEVAGLGTRVLVCTDNWVADTTAFKEVLADLRARCETVIVFTDVAPELPIESVEACATAARNRDIDVVVGFGGGTCIDLAKAASLLLSHPGSIRRHYGENAVPEAVLPIVAVPTTGGTGSEVTPVCVLSDPDVELKVGISSLYLIPTVAICDPELTLTCPPALSASVGADALSHLVESFTAIEREPSATSEDRVFVGKNLLSDRYARWGLSLLGRSLARVVEHPDDASARHDVMLAANAGGYALGVAGTAAAHAIQYPVGALTKTPHGIGVGALLPYVMQLNRHERLDEITEIGVLLGTAAPSDDPNEGAEAGIEAVAQLLDRIGIPTTLSALGVTTADAGYIAERSMLSKRLIDNNPRPLDASTIRRVVDAAISGDRSILID